MSGLNVLVVDDEQPARAELSRLLDADALVDAVAVTDSGSDALRLLDQVDVDAVFMEFVRGDLSGADLVRLLARFTAPPAIVFVTRCERPVSSVSGTAAIDHLHKPVGRHLVTRAVRRVVAARKRLSTDVTIPVELAGVTRFVQRSEVRYVASQGDYARIHTADESHLLRVPLRTLHEQWRAAGFVRIHRSCLVSLRWVREVRRDGPRCAVVVGDTELPVSRRHTSELRGLSLPAHQLQPAQEIAG
ncbi:MAG: LytR/AlgR family response regulator transcription factor [Nocardioidaceae bacterium]